MDAREKEIFTVELQRLLSDVVLVAKEFQTFLIAKLGQMVQDKNLGKIDLGDTEVKSAYDRIWKYTGDYKFHTETAEKDLKATPRYLLTHGNALEGVRISSSRHGKSFIDNFDGLLKDLKTLETTVASFI